MSTHTPGPWTVRISGMRGSFHIPEAQAHEATHSDDGVDGYTVSKANARLIAAAPDLLDFARNVAAIDELWLKAAHHRLLRTAIRELRDAARAAIAKAEGTS